MARMPRLLIPERFFAVCTVDFKRLLASSLHFLITLCGMLVILEILSNCLHKYGFILRTLGTLRNCILLYIRGVGTKVCSGSTLFCYVLLIPRNLCFFNRNTLKVVVCGLVFQVAKLVYRVFKIIAPSINFSGFCSSDYKEKRLEGLGGEKNALYGNYGEKEGLERDLLEALVNCKAGVIFERISMIQRFNWTPLGCVIWEAIVKISYEQVIQGRGDEILDGIMLFSIFRSSERFDDGGPISNLFIDIRGAEIGICTVEYLDSLIKTL